MRRASLCLLTGLSLTFAINCGSGTSGGSGSGGSGGQASGGATGKGGGGAGTNGAGGAAGSHSTGGGTGGDHATGGAGGASVTGGAGGTSATGGAGGASATGGAGGGATGGAGGGATGGAGGGATGSGGHAGAGGGTGTGGSAGAGGHPTGGQGGQAVDSGVSCAELASEYGAALPEAEACTPGAASQCQQLVSTSLGACSCQHYVQDATTLNAIRAQWTSQGCAAPVTTAVVICAIACVSPGTAGSCVASDGAAPGGVCAGIFTPAL